MIPFRMLNGRPGKGLQMSGLAPDVTAGHQEMNYARLQAVKAKYDPSGVFGCHHCVELPAAAAALAVGQ